MDIANALLSGFPGAKWKLEGNDYAKLDWFGPGEKPTVEQIEDAWQALINPPPPPVVVTLRSLQLCMTAQQRQQLAAGLASMTEGPQKSQALIYFQRTTAVSRTHPMVNVFTAFASLDSAGSDALFAAAQAQDQLEAAYLS